MNRLLPQSILVAMFVVTCMVAPGEIERMVAPAKVQLPRGAEAGQAPIWSKRCAAQGKTMVAHQADGGPWIVHCAGKTIRL